MMSRLIPGALVVCEVLTNEVKILGVEFEFGSTVRCGRVMDLGGWVVV